MATRQIKSTNYFSHDSNARNDEKLVRLRMKQGAAGYGVYFMILERLREEADYMSAKDYNMIAFDLRVDAAIVKSVVEDFGLFTFTDDGKCFYSESFTRRMDIKDTQRRQRSEGGKIGMKNRWKKEQGKQDKEVKPQPKATSAPTPKPAPTAQPADNQACLKRFFGKENVSNLEVLLMNFGLKPDDITMIRKVAKEVVAEWEISKKNIPTTPTGLNILSPQCALRLKTSNRQRVRPPRKQFRHQLPTISMTVALEAKMYNSHNYDNGRTETTDRGTKA